MLRKFSIEVERDYLSFAAAHFIIFANGKREALHGHNYQVSVTLEGELDPAGILLDFTTLKPLVKRICDSLDHRTLIQSGHPDLKISKTPREILVSTNRNERLILPRRDALLLPVTNTSTEFLAEYIAKRLQKTVCRRFPKTTLRSIRVAVEEHPGQRGIFHGAF